MFELKYPRLTRKINPLGPIQTIIENPVSKLIPDIPRVMKLRHLRNKHILKDMSIPMLKSTFSPTSRFSNYNMLPWWQF